MTKKVKNAQKPADAEPQTIGENQPAAGVEQEAPALVAGDGGGPAHGTEHQGQPGGADAGTDGSRMGDAEIPYAPGDDAKVAEAAAQDGAEQDVGTDGDSVGVSDDTERDPTGDQAADATGNLVQDEDGGADSGRDAETANAMAGTAAADGDASSGHVAGASGQDGAAGDREATGDDHGAPEAGEAVAAAAGADGRGATEGGQPGVSDAGDAPLDPDGNPAGDDAPADLDGMSVFREARQTDANLVAAFDACDEIVGCVLGIAGGDEETWLLAQRHLTLTGNAYVEAAKLLRKIGHVRATVDVVASQLKLTGHLSEPTIAGPQRVVLECFLFTLASLDGFAKSQAERLAREKAEAERQPPPPVPIEDTTLETVDGPMDTWRV